MAGESGIFTPADVAFVQSGAHGWVAGLVVDNCSVERSLALSAGHPTVPNHLLLDSAMLLCGAAGCGAILVGESIVKQGDPEAAVKTLLELH